MTRFFALTILVGLCATAANAQRPAAFPRDIRGLRFGQNAAAVERACRSQQGTWELLEGNEYWARATCTFADAEEGPPHAFELGFLAARSLAEITEVVRFRAEIDPRDVALAATGAALDVELRVGASPNRVHGDACAAAIFESAPLVCVGPSTEGGAEFTVRGGAIRVHLVAGGSEPGYVVEYRNAAAVRQHEADEAAGTE